ncbi:MAG: heme-copper oxidase subunit III [Candidatus Eremiobacteraeota bacterium]|nr:heme-copper oxidase subunit III [Candidatus Eremiobacteraeota bacterium]MBV9647055.1 heme-copper oxidase subunit III [Candidatus Eremiobacteraeota bacterium]
MATAVATAPLAGHEAVAARYLEVDPVYAETRSIRLLGFVFFLLSDCVLFGAFIFAYVYLRISAPTWPPFVGNHRLPWFDTAFAALNSIVLFGSGVTMHFALENWKHLNRQKFYRWLIATIILGLGFLLGQAHEWTGVLRGGVTWPGSTMGASFFTLTGMHGFHVFVGVCYLTVLGLQARRGIYTGSKYFGLTAGTLYWHFVDVIWVVLFTLFYVW